MTLRYLIFHIFCGIYNTESTLMSKKVIVLLTSKLHTSIHRLFYNILQNQINQKGFLPFYYFLAIQVRHHEYANPSRKQVS